VRFEWAHSVGVFGDSIALFSGKTGHDEDWSHSVHGKFAAAFLRWDLPIISTFAGGGMTSFIFLEC